MHLPGILCFFAVVAGTGLEKFRKPRGLLDEVNGGIHFHPSDEDLPLEPVEKEPLGCAFSVCTQ
jgi:hypothetical protein